MLSILLDIEWLLSTLFDASLLNFRAAGNGGSFFSLSRFGPGNAAAGSWARRAAPISGFSRIAARPRPDVGHATQRFETPDLPSVPRAWTPRSFVCWIG